MNKDSRNKILIVTIFAMAMGFLEAAVVIYVRKLFYTSGFNSSLQGLINTSLLNIEWIREIATIIMLIAIGILAGKKAYEKIAYFAYAFAIWDIFYYIFLKLTIAWPTSLLTSDLLFLIPWPWIGPVIAPILCSLLIIISALIIINFEDKKTKVRINAKEWTLIILGIALVLYTWLYDYGKLIIKGGFANIANFSPSNYNWPVFLLGFAIGALGILLFYLRTKKQVKNN